MRRLVLLVEGDGDVQAMPSLVGRLIAQLPDDLQGQLFLDNAPMRLGGIHQITGKRQGDLARHLGNAAKRPQLGAALLILDGDADRVEGRPFCAVEVARTIAQRATAAGAGTLFSFAAVFLRQEYESLLLPVADQLPGLKPGVILPSAPEEGPRDAKGWLHDNLADGYNPTDSSAGTDTGGEGLDAGPCVELLPAVAARPRGASGCGFDRPAYRLAAKADRLKHLRQTDR
jgi:hypothetical protein